MWTLFGEMNVVSNYYFFPFIENTMELMPVFLLIHAN